MATLAIIANVEARIGRTTYTKLEQAVNAADTASDEPIEIVLVPDTVTKSEKIVIDKDKNIKLDLDGKTLTSTASDYIIENSGKLEIVDTSEEGSGKITSSAYSVIHNTSASDENYDTDDKINIKLDEVKQYPSENENIFVYDESTQQLKNNNQNKLDTTAKGYLELDLGEKTGKYTLTIDAEIASSSGTAYVSITNNPDDSDRAATTNSNYGNILNMSNTTSQKQSIDIAGGQKYYMNLRYKRGTSSKTGVDNEFKINSITLTKKQEGELTLTSGTIEIDKEGKSNTYYSAIENEGLLNVDGGKIISSKNYTSGVNTLAGGTSNINNGELTLTGNNDRAIWAKGKASLTNVKNGKIEADIGVTTTQCIANINVTGGEYSEDCDYQIYHDAIYGLITLDKVTLKAANSNKNCIGMGEDYSDLIIKNSDISNTKGNVFSSSSDYSNVKADKTTLNGRIYCNAFNDSNITLNECHMAYNNNKCIDFAGTNSNIEISNSEITSSGNYYAIDCGGKNTKLTIDNSSIKNESTNKKNGAIDLTDGGIVYIKGETTINSAGPVIYADEDENLELNIVSGTLESTQAQAILMGNTTGDINIGTKGDNEVDTNNPEIKSGNSEWTIDSNRMHLNFYDGRLIGTQDKVIGMSVKELENGYDIVNTENEGEDQAQREVLILDHTVDVAEVENGSENSTQYDTLKEAVEACSKNEEDQQKTIKLLKDIDQTEQIKIEKGQNIKLDLNNNKLYAMTDDTIYNEGKLEITDSTKQLETTDSAQELETADTTEEKEADRNIMCFTGVTVIHNARKTEEDNTTSKGELTIGNGIGIYCTKSGMGSVYKTIIKNEGKLNTNNAEIDATGNYIYPIENLAEAEITGGSITTSGSNAYGVYNDTSETLKLKGVNITTNNSTGSYGVYNKGEGKVEINENTNISTLVQSVYNNGAGDVTINNATISCKNNSAIYNNDTGKITINGGDITNLSSNYACINNNKNGTIEMHGGTVKGENTHAINNQSQGTINVVSGKVISKAGSGIYNYSKGIINLGEKITTKGLEEKEEPSTENPEIKGEGKKSGIDNSKGTLNFYDGIITGPEGKSYSGNVTEKEVGYQVVKKSNEDGTESAILEKVDIIKISDNEQPERKFSTISEFEEALKSIDTSKNYVITLLADFSMSSSEHITIKDNMTAELNINGCTITSAADCTVENKGKLTIKDTKENSQGSIKHEVNGSSNENKCAVKNNEGATLNVESGTISTTGTNDYGIYNKGKLVINGGEITTNESNAHGIYNSESGEAKINGNKISVKNAHAIYNCSNNEMQISNSNITVTGSNSSYGINNNSDGTIEIDGKTTISTVSSSLYNAKNGTITINDGTFTSTRSTVIYNESTGEININDGKMISTSSLSNVFCINNYNGGTINFNGGTVDSVNAGIHNNNYQEEGTINITGGKITSKNSYGVNNNKINKTGTVNITGGTITSEKLYGVYNQQGQLNIGEQIDKEAEKGEDKDPSDEIPTIQGKTYGVYSTGTFNFYDGKIIGEKGKSINHNITDKEKGYQIVKNTDENDELETAVLQNISIFEMDGENYNTIEDAQKAINDITDNNEHTINVINDTYMTKSENITIPNGKNIKLNLNGHSIETSSTNAIKNNGKLEIIGKDNNDKGTILGVSKLIIDNYGELTINGGTYNSINYDSEDYTKVINNTNKVTWRTGNLTLDEGHNYGIYNTGEGIIDWKDGHIRANQITGNQYGIYTDSSNEVNWSNGDIFLNTTELLTQYGIYIKGKGNVNIEKIKFNNIGYNEGASYVLEYSHQYAIYVNDPNAKDGTTISNIKISDFQRETSEGSRKGKVYGIYGSYANLNLENGNFTEFDDAINLSNSTINIKNGNYKDNIVIQKGSGLTIIDGNIDTIDNHGNVTINGGNINYLTTDTGEVTMNQGSINNTGYDGKTKNNGVVEITGGTFTLLGGTINSSTADGVDIQRGTFIMGNNEDAVSTDTPQVTGLVYGVHKETEGNFNFYDGIIKGSTEAINGGVTVMPQNYKVRYESEDEDVDNNNIATLEIDAQIDKIVSVNGVFFDKFETAISHAVNNGSGKVIVYSPITITQPMTITEKANITINLNGHSITAEMEEAIFTNKGHLTIIDEVENPEEDNGDNENDKKTVSKIENSKGCVVINKSTLTIGTQDNNVIKETPVLNGEQDAIQNEGTIYWNDGTIDGTAAEGEKEITKGTSILAKTIKANAEKILEETKEVINSIVQSPNIKVDKELPVWTNSPVTATIYTTDRIMLDIINDNGNVQTTSISVKKIWKMSEEEAKNYRATIQVMKMVDGEKQEVKDISGNLITVEIIGNDTKDIKNLPVSENGKKIEYVLEEIKVEKRTSEDEDDWEEIPVTNFNVTYTE